MYRNAKKLEPHSVRDGARVYQPRSVKALTSPGERVHTLVTIASVPTILGRVELNRYAALNQSVNILPVLAAGIGL